MYLHNVFNFIVLALFMESDGSSLQHVHAIRTISWYSASEPSRFRSYKSELTTIQYCKVLSRLKILVMFVSHFFGRATVFKGLFVFTLHIHICYYTVVSTIHQRGGGGGGGADCDMLTQWEPYIVLTNNIASKKKLLLQLSRD